MASGSGWPSSRRAEPNSCGRSWRPCARMARSSGPACSISSPGSPAAANESPSSTSSATGSTWTTPSTSRGRGTSHEGGTMIAADEFLGPARARGFDFYTGVPCSFLTPIINRVIGDRALTYVGAASEGEAVGIAAGAWLAGRGSVVMCQNSGLGNAVNPLTSLSFPFRIPTLLVVTWRGQPGIHDEPQHELMGQITGRLLETMRIPHRAFPETAEAVAPALDEAEGEMARSELPFAFVMAKDAVRDDGLDQKPPDARPPGVRRDLRDHG